MLSHMQQPMPVQLPAAAASAACPKAPLPLLRQRRCRLAAGSPATAVAAAAAAARGGAPGDAASAKCAGLAGADAAPGVSDGRRSSRRSHRRSRSAVAASAQEQQTESQTEEAAAGSSSSNSDDSGSTSTATATTASSSPTPPAPPPPKITSTLADLDALLGVQEEPPKKEEPAKASSSSSSTSPEAMQQQVSSAGGASPSTPRDDIDGQFARIVEKAKRLAEEQSKGGGSANSETEQAQLKQEFESMLRKLNTQAPGVMSKEDVKRLKDAAFGPQTFWVTDTQPVADLERAGLLIRGNLRDDRAKVYAHVCGKVVELFGADKYTVLLVEDPLATEEDAAMATDSRTGEKSQAALLNSPRVAFQIIPTAQATPPQTSGWATAVAFVLALLFVGSCGQLSLAANVTKLPKETLDWFSNPANYETDALPPGLENWDPTPYFSSAVPVFAALLGTNLSHEVGHRVAAFYRNVKLGPTYFVPNFQIGSFGGITPFTSMLKDRLSMWDVASAGPLTGATVSFGLLIVGLAQSHVGGDAGANPELLVPVPTQLFQGSLLLGSLTRWALGEGALRGTTALVSPMVIAGWCGLVTQALQLLPVGSVDGGRMVQAAFGRQALSLSSFFTYVGLGLGLLGSSLALPFGLYVIICQRAAEQYIQDSVTPPGEPRATVTAVAVLAAILVLLPMAPELADAFGVGPENPFF